MRIQEINNKISENTGRIRQLQKEVSELLNQNSNLSTVKNDILVNSFCDWLQIGQQYHIRNYMSFPGSPTGVAKTENKSANFSNGDVIEFVKKNDKSVIIKVTTKVLSKIDRETGQKTSTTTSGTGSGLRKELGMYAGHVTEGLRPRRLLLPWGSPPRWKWLHWPQSL